MCYLQYQQPCCIGYINQGRINILRGPWHIIGAGPLHGRIGIILFGGAHYSLPEQANLTLIFFPKIVGEGGEVTKIIFPDIPKKFSGHTYKHSTKFSLHSKKNSRNFRKDTKIFLRHIKIFQKSLCFARISQ